MMNVLILAGGFGTRMREVYTEVPKPLVPVNRKPILHHCIEQCVKYGFKDILVSTHYQHEVIKKNLISHFQSKLNLAFNYESTPVGTAGALQLAISRMENNFLVLYADIYCDVNLKKLMEFHVKNNSDVTLTVHPNNHPQDSDIILMDRNTCRVREIVPHKNRPVEKLLPNCVNAALYILKKDAIPTKLASWDIAQQLVPNLIVNNKKVFAYETIEYLKDMGTPARLIEVEKDIISGKVRARNDKFKRMAIFLDRDGCINEHLGYVTTPEQLSLLPGVAESIKKLNHSRYLTFCVTNQPVVARGDVTSDELDQIHNKLESDLGAQSAFLDGISYCPHHPDAGFDGEVKSLKINCNCRKPKAGMLEKLAMKWNIDLSKSWVLGDCASDVIAGKTAGSWTILLTDGDQTRKGSALMEPPDFIFRDTPTAIDFILSDFQSILKQAKKVMHDITYNEYTAVLISGAVRSGKSSFASTLRGVLQYAGYDAIVFSTDEYLIGSGPLLASKHQVDDFSKLFKFFKRSKLNGKRSKLHLNELNRHIECAPIKINHQQIIIIEGERIPLELENEKVFNILVSTTEKKRLRRFIEKYKNCGLHESQVIELYRENIAEVETKSSENIYEVFT